MRTKLLLTIAFEGRLWPRSIVEAFGSRQRNWQRFRDAFNEYDFIVSPTMMITAPKWTPGSSCASSLLAPAWRT